MTHESGPAAGRSAAAPAAATRGWMPWRALIGAYLFGGITVLQLNLQAAGSAIPVEYLSMSPYLITIAALVWMSSGKGKAAHNAPAALGQNFHASR